MSRYDDYEDLPQRERKRSKAKQRSKGPTKPLDGKRLLAQLNVLQHELVFWSGEAPDEFFEVNGQPFWTIHYGLAQELAKKPSGIYVRLSERDYKRIDRGTLTHLQKLYNDANRHRDVLRKQMAHHSSWLSLAERKLQLLERVLFALDAFKRKKVEALVLEALCIWVGRDENRPSHWLATAEIDRWLQTKGESRLPGKRLGAVVLGKRDHECKLYDSHKTWWRYGRMLDQWPAGLVALLKGGNQEQLKDLLQRCPQINSKAAVLGVFDYLWKAPRGDLMEFLEAMPVVIGAFRKCLQYTEKSKREFTDFLQIAMQFPFANNLDKIPKPNKSRPKWLGVSDEFLEHLKKNLTIRMRRDGFSLKSRYVNKDPFIAASIYFLGMRPELKWKRHFSRLKSNDLSQMEEWFLAGIHSMLLKEIGEPDCRLEQVACSIFGTCAALAGCENTALAFSEWLDASRKYWAPGKSGLRHIEYALYHLNEWMNQSKLDSENLQRLTEILQLNSGDIYGDSQRLIGDFLKVKPNLFEWDSLNPTYILSKFGFLEYEHCQLLLKNHLLDYAEIFLGKNQDRKKLPEMLEVLDIENRNWMARWIKMSEPVRFYKEYESTTDFLKTILAWCDSAKQESGFEDNEIYYLFDILYGWCYGRNRKRANKFLDFFQRHPWFLKRLSTTAAFFQQFNEEQLNKKWDSLFYAIDEYGGLVGIAIEWEKLGWKNLKPTILQLFDNYHQIDQAIAAGKHKSPAIYRCRYIEIPLMVQLSNQDLEKLKRLLLFETETLKYTEDCLNGWKYLQQFESIRKYLSEALDRPEWTTRVFRLLSRIAIAVRFQSKDLLNEKFSQWEQPDGNWETQELKLPKNVEVACRQLIHWRSLAGKPDTLPKTVQQILKRPQSIQKEYEFLCQKAVLTKEMKTRKENLEHYLANKKELERWVVEDLREQLRKQSLLAKLDALENCVQLAIDQHWQKILGPVQATTEMNSSDWDNALILYSNIDENRSLLRRLLRSEAVGDRSWYQSHQENLKFLRKMEKAGMSTKAWRKDWRETVRMRDGNWTIYTETEPLKVLQMGNIFGTCLSINDFNNFSTVANALEANKRVIYITSPQGKIIGRKLILFTDELKFVGCYSYGSGDSPWIKILLDLFCKKIMRAVGIKREQLEIEDSWAIESKNVSLFAKTYYDLDEDWDEWIFERNVSLKQIQFRSKPNADWLTKYLPEEKKALENETLCRAILYLGETSLPAIKKLKPEKFEKEDWQSIQKHARQARLRNGVKKIINPGEP